MKSLKKNYLYNIIYQLLLLFLPLALAPYLSRALGAVKIGEYSYAQSVLAYFILFGTAGTGLYAQREIAYVQQDRQKRLQAFFEILLLRLAGLTAGLAFYFVYVCFTAGSKTLFLIQGLELVAAMLDITWYFQGMEEFGRIVVRNAAVKVLGASAVFVFVKESGDLNLYVLINAVSMLAGQLSLWLYLYGEAKGAAPGRLHLKRHLPGVLQMFVPQAAMQVYLVLDKTMIGLITGRPEENGYYEQSQKLVKMCLTVVTALGTVMLPRMSLLYTNRDSEGMRAYLYGAFRCAGLMGFPIMFGLMGTASGLVPWFFGSGFLKVVPLIWIFSLLVPAIGCSNVIGMQYLIPVKRQRAFTVTVAAGGLVNFLLNLALIPRFLSLGAAAASVTAEWVITLLQCWYVRDVIPVSQIVKIIWRYALAAALMYAAVSAASRSLAPTAAHTAFLILAGGLIYIVLLAVLGEEMTGKAFKKLRERVLAKRRKDRR